MVGELPRPLWKVVALRANLIPTHAVFTADFYNCSDLDLSVKLVTEYFPKNLRSINVVSYPARMECLWNYGSVGGSRLKLSRSAVIL